MGTGYEFQCEKCGKTFSIHLGFGFGFQEEVLSVIEDIKDGKYGEVWKNLYNSNPNVAVDAEQYLYKCGNCGHWKTAPGLTFYTTKHQEILCDGETREKVLDNDETISEEDIVPFYMRYDLDHKYTLWKRYTHLCPKCGKRMRKITKESEACQLPCPDCGKMCYGYKLMWD